MEEKIKQYVILREEIEDLAEKIFKEYSSYFLSKGAYFDTVEASLDSVRVIWDENRRFGGNDCGSFYIPIVFFNETDYKGWIENKVKEAEAVKDAATKKEEERQKQAELNLLNKLKAKYEPNG
jgi:hypothetical protein